ncbi:disease resistance protein RPV1 isoform X2 [Rosa chinensis]|uniref:disease resistance protein RPV1 isoform X2 n=1 Tax=Rosa chinensis TaxID=74649 RepID=UPI001AD93D4F|nr:disease resistance protein RPV1 isoform X2 [Rosa chinensis]
MALSTHRASPSLAWDESPPRWKFDVFLSFRGEDTRWGFISHLYCELQFWRAFKIFKDDRELEIGASISPELLRAIEQSHLAIVVLSPDYASSTWCLDELSKIIESMETGDKRILPVFFNVDPSDVRHQRSSFADAFAKHKVKFSNQIEKVERWREALKKVSNFSGWHAKNFKCESELIQVIVRCVWEKLHPPITLSDCKDKLVGIEIGLGQMSLYLAPEEKDVRIIGIWGMGGVGKTTLARLVYEKLSHKFEVAKFLVDGTIVDLQKQILSPILKENNSQVWNEHEGTLFIRRYLSNKKVLLVFDDVNRCDHLKSLTRYKSWFGDGSRIIVTTRDERVLIQNDIEMSFELAGLSHSKALELFCQHAFKKDQPEEGFSELAKCFVDYAQGLPLALEVLGGFLYKRDLDAWNSELESLKRIPDPTIFNLLKLSYDALDDLQKNIFLDIAFFYKGLDKRRVIELLQYCYGLNVRIVIDVLKEKSLLTIGLHNNVGMHGLVQEMAWEIVRQESREEPGLRSHLCHRNDIFHVFMRNTGTEAIKGIRLCLPLLEEADSSWNCECFSKMPKLMFLEFDNLIISSGPKSLPNSLIILKWNWYPSKSLPAGFRPNILAELKMPRSNLVRLWDGRKDLPNLKYMDLTMSKNLKETPDFTVNKKLKRLTLYGCENVKVFPSKIEMDSLEFLSLDGCSKVKIPEFGEGMKNLSQVLASGTASEELPSSIEHLVGLTYLLINDSKRKLYMGFTGLFKRSPEPVCLALPSPRALSLRLLSLDYCNLEVIPDDIGYCLPSLEWLHLCGNNFVSLPPSIKCLSKLTVINLRRCKRLQQLPDLPSNEELEVLADDCDSLKMLSKPSQQGRFTKLVSFRLTTVNCFGLIDNEGLNNGIFSMLSRLAAQGISLSGDCFRPSLDIVSPGNKISEWFDIQSEGDSLTVELPPDQESEWMGIVFCVVFAHQKDPDTLKIDHFLIECSSPGIHREHSLQMETHGMGDHIWVSFMPRGQIQDTTSCSIRFSFDTHSYGLSGYIPCSNCVKRCGARLLYEQDLKNLLDGKTNILKRSHEYCDSEEAEPGEGPSAIAIGCSNKESVFKRLKASGGKQILNKIADLKFELMHWNIEQSMLKPHTS